MNHSENNNYIINYSIYGLILAIMYTADIYVLTEFKTIILNFSLYGVYEYYKLFPINWVFDFIVIVSYVFLGYFLGRYFKDKQYQLSEELKY